MASGHSPPCEHVWKRFWEDVLLGCITMCDEMGKIHDDDFDKRTNYTVISDTMWLGGTLLSTGERRGIQLGHTSIVRRGRGLKASRMTKRSHQRIGKTMN